MMTLDDLIKDMQYYADGLPERAEMAAIAAADAVSVALDSVPVGLGETPNLSEAMHARSQIVKSGSVVLIGISRFSSLGDPEKKAPRGTIREFLAWWRSEFPTRSGEGHRPKHQDKSRAWWDLSMAQKMTLERERGKGRFGGIPGKAPYWWIQEVGSSGAGIAPQGYLQRARAIMDQTVPRAVERVLNA